MSEGEILVSAGEQSDAGDELVRSLPSWMPSDEGSGNFKLLDVVGRGIDRLDGDIEAVDNAATVQDAESIAQIEQLARLVQLSPRENEELEHYRARTMVRYAINTSEGTISDIFNGLASIFDTDVENFRYQDWTKLYDIKKQVFLIPFEEVQGHPFGSAELTKVLKDLTAPGKTVEPMWNGDLIAWSAEEYEAEDNWSLYGEGMDGLDADGNPYGDGGKPAGTIE